MTDEGIGPDKPQRPWEKAAENRRSRTPLLGLPDFTRTGPWWLPLVFAAVVVPQFVYQSMHFHWESLRLLGYAGCAVVALCFIWAAVQKRRSRLEGSHEADR